MAAPPAMIMPDGRDVRAYDDTKGFSRRDWAWEFLRRNREFRAVMAKFSRHILLKTAAPNVTLCRIRRGAPSLSAWGVIFRDVGV
jgi:hypothetical protein